MQLQRPSLPARRFALACALAAVLSVSCSRGPTEPTNLSIISVRPAEISSHDSQPVVLYGTGFRAGGTIKFGDQPGTITRIDGRLMYVTTPAAPPGRVDIVLTNADGQVTRLAGGFTFLDFFVGKPPGPLAGVSYDAVRIDGAGFGPGTRLLFDGVDAALFQSGSRSIIRALAPPRGPGQVEVTVIAPDGRTATLPGGFTYDEVTLAVNTPVVDPGGSLTVNWNCPCNHFGFDDNGDLLRLYRVGVSEEVEVWGSQVWSTTGAVSLPAPLQPGTYEFRYVVQQRYAIASAAVTIRRQ